MLNYINKVLEHMPSDWLHLTTHRLDIYNEEQAKTQFLDEFKKLYGESIYDKESLEKLPTAYDYIRLGHPLSTILEWLIAEQNNLDAEQVISFSSKIMPILAVLRCNNITNNSTQIVFTDDSVFDSNIDILKSVYGYKFELKKLKDFSKIPTFEGSTIVVTMEEDFNQYSAIPTVDFQVNILKNEGSIILINTENSDYYISQIQHVRRRETIAMTPANSLNVLNKMVQRPSESSKFETAKDKAKVIDTISDITDSKVRALVASSGLSMQYAIVMGLIHDGLENNPGKPIRIVVPPNCYGGTNDQARRVAASVKNVEIVDLPVDGDNDMVLSTEMVLEELAKEDAIPLIIAEIPTNPRVEVPNLLLLKEALEKKRINSEGNPAVEPIFILDQTFCPNTHFLGEKDILSSVKTIAYVSGSKFPSGGKCTAGYCTSNKRAEYLMEKIALHLNLCDNEATNLQYQILAQQMPSMNQRIKQAYINTREFVNFIEETLPEAKINFVSEDLAKRGFTPSVFSLDLPTKGNTELEKEAYKRELNHKLINLMISEIPEESKYCVSYGQLHGCYWTIPATSTQGTTKENDKDYIARVAVSPDLDLERHKKVFADFVSSI